MKYLFAGILGVMFSLVVMAVIAQPYALVISAIGSVIIGWYSNDIRNFIFGGK